MSRDSALGGARQGRMNGVEVLGSRILLRPLEPERSRRFYRDTLGLAVCREFGHPMALASCSFSAAASSR